MNELAGMMGSSPQQLQDIPLTATAWLPPNPVSLGILINTAQDGDGEGGEDPGLEW